jgi:hypothetical protein
MQKHNPHRYKRNTVISHKAIIQGDSAIRCRGTGKGRPGGKGKETGRRTEGRGNENRDTRRKAGDPCNFSTSNRESEIGFAPTQFPAQPAYFS